MEQLPLLTVILTVIVILSTIDSSHGRRGYILTAPKSLISGTNERMCMALYNVSHTTHFNINLQLRNGDTYTQSEVFHGGHGHCFNYQVPLGLEPRLTELSVVGHSADGDDSNVTFQGSTQVRVEATKTLAYIQTDKPVYKPGQTVQFRILTLKADLKPKVVQLDLVVLEDPSGTRVMQWRNVSSTRGLVSLSVAMSDEPVLGTWKLKAQLLGEQLSQTFKVGEYVLPKFEVAVNMPPYVMIDAQEINGSVCAKYTYGKPVKGSVRLTACIIQKYGNRQRPCSTKVEKIDGCLSFSFDAVALQMASRDWYPMDAKVVVNAVITEEATGISLNGSSSHTTVEMKSVKIHLNKDTRDYFKPGLPFYGKCIVTKPDGKPAGGEVIEISVRNYRNNKRFAQNYTSDENGVILYTLPPTEKNVVEFSINAKKLLPKSEHGSFHRPRQTIVFFHVRQWFSPSGSFLQIHPLGQDIVCGSTLEVNVSYTTQGNTNFLFYYEVMSRGNIVWSGHKRHHFTGNDRQSDEMPEESVEVTKAHRQRRSFAPVWPLPPFEDEDEPVIPSLGHTATFPISITVTPEMSPDAKLLVYYIRPDGEVIADSVEMKVERCFDNQASLSFSAEQLLPGEAVQVQMAAAPGSLCALGVVDKSVHLLGGNNQLTADRIFSSLKQYNLDERTAPRPTELYCNSRIEDGPPRPPPPGAPMPRRQRRMIWPGGSGYSKYYDSSEAFESTGMVTISDLELATRPCTRRPDMVYYSMAVFDTAPGSARNRESPLPMRPSNANRGRNTKRKMKKQAPKAVVDLRTYFPETWLWKLVDIGTEGRTVLEETMPHSLTEWVGSSFCVSSTNGVGVSAPAAVKGFQPFFVSFTLPYSVVRREKVPIIVTVFNYLSDCLVVDLTLKKNTGIRVVSESRNHKVCVCGSQSVSHTYHIIANIIGKVNITVKAEAVRDDSVCGNNEIISSEVGARDAVTRTLIVEPEGREEEYSLSSYICPGSGPHIESFDLHLPDNVIRDSPRAYVTAIGDVMGAALSGLDELLRLPTGCGEQNMLKFAPNIFVLQYLTQTNQDAERIRQKAIDFMRIGYQRELTYRHNDGSYSAFGKTDKEGSMWLTAFVVKSFAQAREFIDIDEQDLSKSVAWFRERQLENGCFPQVGRVLHQSMKGGLASGNQHDESSTTATLTAYVLAAMLESGIDRQDRAVQDALLCLRSNMGSDVYTTALAAYAASLYDPASALRANLLDTLDSMAIKEGGMVSWRARRPDEATSSSGRSRAYHGPQAADVEMTAYALLAYILGGQDSAIQNGLPIVRWLTKQRNAHGGFASTQDTVVALQALAKYAQLTYSAGINIDMHIVGRGINHTFLLNEDNTLLLQTEKIEIPNNLELLASGQGCGLFQANVKYNVPLTRHVGSPLFAVRVMVPNRGVGRGRGACKKRTMTVCARYNPPGKTSNMAIISVKMVSGWIPDKESIRSIKQNIKLGVKRIEVDHKWVNFYLDELTNNNTCIKFIVEQDMDIENAKPALVHVYDYYDQEISTKEKYRIKRICGTKSEIPVLTREEVAEREEEGIIEQRRVIVDPPFLGIPAEMAESNCPTCLMTTPKSFSKDFCLSRHAYKVDVHTEGELRFVKDVRPASPVAINKVVNVTSPAECSCETLSSGRVSKVLVLTKRFDPIAAQPTLTLGADDTVLPFRGLNRRMRQAQSSRVCRI